MDVCRNTRVCLYEFTMFVISVKLQVGAAVPVASAIGLGLLACALLISTSSLQVRSL